MTVLNEKNCVMFTAPPPPPPLTRSTGCNLCPCLLISAGIYVCPKCGHELFSAKAKYKHNTPWPAFTETVHDDSVSKENETEPQQSSKAKALKVHG